jgi:UDP-N-acetylmuramoyl-L-alanyl-D-glutamate--2,6-diaminopimelate ligase
MLRDMVDIGKEFAVVEATSHGLSHRMNRLGDVAFDAAVLTNVTHEHLEFHGSFEQYRSDKANLFRALSATTPKLVPCPRFGVVNADEPHAEYFTRCARVPVFSYGVKKPADLAARVTRAELSGSEFVMIHKGSEAEAHIAIPGPFWVENWCAASLTVARLLDIDPLSLAPHAARLRGVQGRMDYVDLGQPFAVIVDYAHTPGAFQKLLPWVREHTTGEITAVFGSAGERDSAKRPLQGRAAAEHCDTKRGEELVLVPDRREAVRLAVSRARPGDTVLLLGKGHEGSIIGPSGPAAWDERAEAESALRSLGYTR